MWREFQVHEKISRLTGLLCEMPLCFTISICIMLHNQCYVAVTDLCMSYNCVVLSCHRWDSRTSTSFYRNEGARVQSLNILLFTGVQCSADFPGTVAGRAAQIQRFQWQAQIFNPHRSQPSVDA